MSNQVSAPLEDNEHLDRAVEYMRTTFGDKAVEEAEKGLAYAQEVNNEMAIEAFSAILRKLKLPDEGS